jgi:hypothetical protein
VARWWLERARLRRTMRMVVSGIMENQKRDLCATCSRTVESGTPMQVDVANNGAYDPHGLDKLVASFLEEFPNREFDPVLWKAHFRKHAQLITRCLVCVDAMERQRRERAVALRRATRPEDVSSDEEGEDDDAAMFEPLVVARASAEGKLLSKWLGAARRRLGGSFPRPQARVEMERYAKRMRDRQAAKSQKALERRVAKARSAAAAKRAEAEAEAADMNSRLGRVVLNAASKAVMLRWLGGAKQGLDKRERDRAVALRTELEKTLSHLKEEDDWYYGSETRLNGERLAREGKSLLQKRQDLETEEAQKARKLQRECDAFLELHGDELERLRDAMEKTLEQMRESSKRRMEDRIREITAAKREREVMFSREEAGVVGAELIAMQKEHAAELEGLDRSIEEVRERRRQQIAQKSVDMQSDLGAKERQTHEKMEEKRASTNRRLASLREDYQRQRKLLEETWRAATREWVSHVTRKIQTRAAEEAAEDAAKVDKAAPKKKKGSKK